MVKAKRMASVFSPAGSRTAKLPVVGPVATTVKAGAPVYSLAVEFPTMRIGAAVVAVSAATSSTRFPLA